MRGSFFPSAWLVTPLALAVLAGCGGGKGSTVTGTVTYNGQPVEKGNVNFFPEDGKSAPAGGTITGGRYSVANVSPGKNKVVVGSQPAGEAPSSMGDPKKLNTGSSAGTVQPTDEGNSKVHDIGSGNSELNLDLKTYSSSGPPLKK